MANPSTRGGKVIDCSMPNEPYCSICSSYDICVAECKVKGIEPAMEIVEEGGEDEDTNI